VPKNRDENLGTNFWGPAPSKSPPKKWMDNVKEDVEATELKVQQAIVTIINYNKKKSHVRGRI